MAQISYAAFGFVTVLVMAAPVAAQEVTAEQIIRALSPEKTRSLSIGAPAASANPGSPDVAFLDTLRNKTGGALSPEARENLKRVAADKREIDLPIQFDFRSDALRGESLLLAKELGRALSDPRFANQTFVIAGHTDAKGGDAVNQRLSERRAEAVKRYLVEHYKLPAANLIAVGYGKSRLKNEADPMNSENRRVQAVNLSEVKTAGR